MGWNEFYQRRDALDAAVAQGKPLPGDVFTDERAVLLALHHRWSLRLAARVELAQIETEQNPTIDPVDAIGEAWRRTAEENPDLRRLLDEHTKNPALHPAAQAEQRMLARAACLTEPGDSEQETAAIGAAFLALQRTRPTGTTRRSPVERLLRRLVPTA